MEAGFASTDSSFEDKIHRIAEDACRRAGACILKGSGSISLSNDIKSKIGSRDIVTEVDKLSQDVIRDTILAAFPDHSFLGEEDVDPGKEAASEAIQRFEMKENLWIVDPIDGTTNFAHGMPLCGVILSYVSKGTVMFGAIYDPFRDELFTAWRGKGAFLNGRKISCCETSELKSAVVCTGSPPNFLSLEACLRATNLISSKVRTMRMLGSAATMLSWVACGRVTAYFEADLNVWDLAAGALIIQEAGGKVTDVWGKPYSLRTRNIVASNTPIHSILREQLVEAEMWMKE